MVDASRTLKHSKKHYEMNKKPKKEFVDVFNSKQKMKHQRNIPVEALLLKKACKHVDEKAPFMCATLAPFAEALEGTWQAVEQATLACECSCAFMAV